MIFAYNIYHVIKLHKSLTCLCGNKDNLGIVHKSQSIPDVLGKFLDGMIVFFDKIPFIYSYDNCFSAFMCDSRDLGILIGNTVLSINDKNGNIRSLNGSDGTKYHIMLKFVFYLALSAKSGRINECVLLAVIFHIGIYRISCCSCNI